MKIKFTFRKVRVISGHCTFCTNTCFPRGTKCAKINIFNLVLFFIMPASETKINKKFFVEDIVASSVR